MYVGSNCETYFLTTTPYCTFCDEQAAALEAAKAESALLLSNAVQAQNISLISALQVHESYRQVSELVANQVKGQTYLNETFQSTLNIVLNEINDETFAKNYASTAQELIIRATFLILQVSSKAQLAESLHASQVDQKTALFNEMLLSMQNIGTTLPLDLYQREENFLNRTVKIIESSKSIELAEISVRQSENEAKATLLQAVAQIKLFKKIISWKLYRSLRTQIEEMKLLISNVVKKTDSSISKTRFAKNVLVNASLLQNTALKAALKVELLSLCYPNPCLHGGMCTVNSKTLTHTCFCSTQYMGTKIYLHIFFITDY